MTSPAPERLRLSGATRSFGPAAGVFGVDLSVAVGEIHALVGLNGAGKTTLMRAVLGMSDLDAGEIRIDGIPVEDLPTSRWGRVGHYLDQAFAYPELAVTTNLAIVADLQGVPRAEQEASVSRVEAAFALTPYSAVRARRLSQGNRQRLGLAAAMLHDPDLLVLDEPSSALDPAGVLLLRETLRRRAGEGAGILVSSHHLDEVARVADRITLLHRGRVVGSLDPAGTDLERAFFEIIRRHDAEDSP